VAHFRGTVPWLEGPVQWPGSSRPSLVLSAVLTLGGYLLGDLPPRGLRGRGPVLPPLHVAELLFPESCSLLFRSEAPQGVLALHGVMHSLRLHGGREMRDKVQTDALPKV